MIESLLKRIIELLHRISTVMKVVITKGGRTTIYDATDAHISAISLYGSTTKDGDTLIIPSGKVESGIKADLVRGAMSYGVIYNINQDLVASTNRLSLVNPFYAKENSHIDLPNGFEAFWGCSSTVNGLFEKVYTTWTSGRIEFESGKYWRFTIRKSDNSNITTDDINTILYTSSINAKDIIANFSLTAENELNVFPDASGNKIENYKYQTFSSASSFDDTSKRAYFTLSDNALYNSEPLLSTDNTAKIWNPSNLKSMYVQYDDSYNLTKVNQELATNPLQVVYELPEQVVTELTAEEVAGMLSLQTYSDYTEITSDTDVTIKYFTDSENGREFSALQAKAVNFPAGVSLQNLEEEVIEDVSE